MIIPAPGRRAPRGAALLVVLLLARSAQATTLLALSEQELVREAEVVALVEIRSVRVENAGGLLVTRADAVVLRAVKGAPRGAALSIVVPGGVIGDWVQHVSGAPQLEEGERSVVFLEPTGGGDLRFVGLEQGRLRVDASTSTGGGPGGVDADAVVLRDWTARYVTRDAQGRLVEAAPPPRTERLLPLLERLRLHAESAR